MKNVCLNFFMFVMLVVGFSQSAAAVSLASNNSPTTKSMWLTTSAAQRAHNDVQIRRLKNLFADKQLEADEYYQQLIKLNASRKADKTK